MGTPLCILVLSDTHDHLPPRLDLLAADADEIWHLGDVCAPSLLAQVRAAGPPVTIVRGNCDSEASWPLQVDLERNGKRFRLVHIPPDRAPADIDVLLHGHTHVPRYERVGHALFLNPGCVTRPNRGAAASVAYLRIAADGKIDWKLQTTR